MATFGHSQLSRNILQTTVRKELAAPRNKYNTADKQFPETVNAHYKIVEIK
jgi:hypothetical protein